MTEPTISAEDVERLQEKVARRRAEPHADDPVMTEERKRMPEATISAEDLTRLQEKVARLEAEREAQNTAMERRVVRLQSRVAWAKTLSLPASSHMGGCPQPPERIESFDSGSKGHRVIRCIECGGQVVFHPDHNIMEG